MLQDETEADPQLQPPSITVDELLDKCHALLNELEQFRVFLVERKKEHTIEIRQFRNSVVSELKSLERVFDPLSLNPIKQIHPFGLTRRVVVESGPHS